MKLKYPAPEEFLKEETLCGYTVSAEMKKVWAVEIDLLQELLRVCQKYNLPIYADGGTLIGTMRHQGFIPWDDDIDMVMFREDYDRLCEVAPQEFAHPYFFQTVATDLHYGHRHAQLRNSETACWSVKHERPIAKSNAGIFVDIFVMDGMPCNPRDLDKHYRRIKSAKNRLKFVNKLMEHMPEGIYRWCREHTTCLSDKALYARYEDVLRSVPAKTSLLVCKISLRYNHFFKTTRSLGQPRMVPYAYTQIPVPEDYDELLTQQFGNWRTPTQSPTYHGAQRYDTEHSYLELVK